MNERAVGYSARAKLAKAAGPLQGAKASGNLASVGDLASSCAVLARTVNMCGSERSGHGNASPRDRPDRGRREPVDVVFDQHEDEIRPRRA